MIKINDQIYIDTDSTALAAYTTFRLGGPCKGVCNCTNKEQLIYALKFIQNNKSPFLVIGQGSNLLVSDQGIDAYVLRYFSETPNIKAMSQFELEVEGATILDHLAAYCAEQGLKGINYASGIPGTVAGAIVGNAGAYGQQIGDIVKYVQIFDTGLGIVKTLEGADLNFAYRESFLKHSNDILLSARLKFSADNPIELKTERQSIINERKDKHPDWHNIPSAGSVFKNVAPTSNGGRRKSAGWFLDEAGAKNFQINGAKVFPKHANIIIKDGECSAQDVLNLIKKMQEAVRQHFKIELEPEIRVIGKFTPSQP
ncbi:MAG: UDP-N-acetylmuramate dehydrogenase [Candidatus Omnitrophica bacterium]|nr:UDP-N-acetylmuramate dehydrogenase [Candidatus Omnitrophota bacterium]